MTEDWSDAYWLKQWNEGNSEIKLALRWESSRQFSYSRGRALCEQAEAMLALSPEGRKNVLSGSLPVEWVLAHEGVTPLLYNQLQALWAVTFAAE